MKTFLILAFLATCAFAVDDYCNMPSCNGKAHIGCNNSGKFADACLNEKMMELTESLIGNITSIHNARRNVVTSGREKPLLPAARMEVMKWDPELAQLAALNVLQCQVKPDSCHDTVRFPNSGQNVYSSSAKGSFQEPKAVIREAIDAWYNEKRYATMADIDSSPADVSKIGRFLLLVKDTNTYVGCAGSQFTGNGVYKSLFVCNYAKGNVAGQQIYKSSDVAASRCITRATGFPLLCGS